VLLVDRDVEPRRKPCGEGLFPAGIRELAKLGVGLDEIGAPGLREICFHAGNQVAAARFAGAGAAGVRRPGFDCILRERARSAGVEIRSGVTVTGIVARDGRIAALETASGAIDGRMFVAADGLHSRLRRKAGLDQRHASHRYGLAAHVTLASGPAQRVDVFFGRGHELYITPVGGCSVNVAVLCDRKEVARLRTGSEASIAALLDQHPYFAGGFEVEDRVLATGPFGRGCRRAWRANLVLAGDAAGFFDGISGQGISSALIGGRLCADAVDAVLDGTGEAPLQRYERQRRAIVRNSNLLARLSLLLARDSRVAQLAVRNLSRRPATFERLVALNSGEAGLRSLRPADVSALLFGL